MTNGPEWVLFDQNGTLLDPATIVPALPAQVMDPDGLVLRALDRATGQAMAFTLCGEHPAFPDLLRAGLRAELELGGAPVDDSALDAAMQRATTLRPFPEAGAALDLLTGAGLRLGVITNSATDSSERSLTEAGLRDRIDAVVGSDQVGAYKPDQRFYRHCLETIGVAPERACMVAAHWWDLHGARTAGMRTAWVTRKEKVWLESVPTPDHRGPDLRAVAEAIAAHGRDAPRPR